MNNHSCVDGMLAKVPKVLGLDPASTAGKDAALFVLSKIASYEADFFEIQKEVRWFYIIPNNKENADKIVEDTIKIRDTETSETCYFTLAPKKAQTFYHIILGVGPLNN